MIDKITPLSNGGLWSGPTEMASKINEIIAITNAMLDIVNSLSLRIEELEKKPHDVIDKVVR